MFTTNPRVNHTLKEKWAPNVIKVTIGEFLKQNIDDGYVINRFRVERVWTSEEIVDFISEIQQYPCLFDPACKDKKNTAITGRAKAAIALKFHNCSK